MSCPARCLKPTGPMGGIKTLLGCSCRLVTLPPHPQLVPSPSGIPFGSGLLCTPAFLTLSVRPASRSRAIVTEIVVLSIFLDGTHHSCSLASTFIPRISLNSLLTPTQ